MRATRLATILFVGVLSAGGATAWAQGQAPPESGARLSSADLALTFTTEKSTTTTVGNNFWFRGGSVDGGVTFYHGLGAAANLTLEHAGDVAPSVSIDKASFMAGPRYTFHFGNQHGSRLFVESLFGFAHVRDGVIPTSSGVNSSASSFSLQLGGGWDVAVTKAFAIRLFEADYVHTSLPNGAANVQDHLRLAFGAVYHLHWH